MAGTVGGPAGIPRTWMTRPARVVAESRSLMDEHAGDRCQLAGKDSEASYGGPVVRRMPNDDRRMKMTVMTEADWISSDDPEDMLDFLHGQVGDRRLRLFACACVRIVWTHLEDDRSRKAVEVAERYADGQTTEAQLVATSSSAFCCCRRISSSSLRGQSASGASRDARVRSAMAWSSSPSTKWGSGVQRLTFCRYGVD